MLGFVEMVVVGDIVKFVLFVMLYLCDIIGSSDEFDVFDLLFVELLVKGGSDWFVIVILGDGGWCDFDKMIVEVL